MPGSQLWAALFFIMLFCLGLSSMFGNLEGILTPLLDLHLVPPFLPKEIFTGLMCLFCFIAALIFTMGSGNYWLEIFNTYATWRFISPLMLLVVFLAYVVIEAESQPTYNAWNPDF
ncbi:hypothetical protein CRUP_003363, partial [Coryphaenoides rupestris]